MANVKIPLCTVALLLVALIAYGADENPYPAGFDLKVYKQGEGVEIVVLTVDPAKAEFRVAYANPPKPGNRFAEDSGAVLVVNGGYWDAEYRPTDLVVVAGKTIKKANLKNSHYGLFYVKGGKVDVRDLRDRPLGKDETFAYAVKSGPVLVRKGGVANRIKSESSHARCAVGRDKKGRIFFALHKRGRMTYNEFSAFLLTDKVDADYAFNLDGGSSVSYVLKRTDGKIVRKPGPPISSVIEVFAK